jgi:phage gp46-like protein
MELELKNGDYVADGVGGLRRLQGREALLQRVLFRLTAKKGSFPFWEGLGSRLWTLGRVPAPERQSAARQYVAEALSAEPVTVEDVTLAQSQAGAAVVTVRLRYEGESLPVAVEILP